MSDARVAAFQCLTAVEAEGAYANLAMPEVLAAACLSTRDAAFATELAYGAIRMRGLYDAVVGHAAGRPVAQIDPPVLRALRLGVHQALGMRVPPHAAVDETVSLVRTTTGARATGFANAVMRRVVSRDRDAWLDRVAPLGRDGSLALRHSHPEWVATLLEEALAADGRAGELEAALASANPPATPTLVARPGLISREDLVRAIPGAAATRFSPLGVATEGGDPGMVAAVADGRAGVQDEGSQLVVEALVAARVGADGERERREGERWLDACAGPGGKAALLGAFAASVGAHVDALEVHPHRADLVRSAVRALPEGVVSVHAADATAWEGGTYDRILLDVPCTGFGALRRRPEARWRRAPQDLQDLLDLQRRLLASAIDHLAPGGVLAYVTCSPVVAETRSQVEGALRTLEGGLLRELDARVAIAAATGTAPEEWGSGPAVQLWTHAHGTDSMFLALLTRDPAGGPER